MLRLENKKYIYACCERILFREFHKLHDSPYPLTPIM